MINVNFALKNIGYEFFFLRLFWSINGYIYILTLESWNQRLSAGGQQVNEFLKKIQKVLTVWDP